MPLNQRDFIIKRNDTLPVLRLCLFDYSNLTTKIPFDLSGATACTFSMTDKYGNYKIAGSTASILSSSGGTIQYEWSSGDTNEAGKYRGEFQLFFDNGKRLTIPQQGFLNIEIPPDLVV
jgi:hypothetical protein